MKRIALSAITLVCVLSSPALSQPPSAMSAEYDAKKKILHLEVKHVVYDVREHYIRRIFITRNDESPIVLRYVRQETPTGFTDDVPLDAKKGDMIHIKAICSDAGIKEVTLEIN